MRAKKRLIKLITKYPYLLAGLMLIITIGSSTGLNKLQKEYDQKAWFKPGDPAVAIFDEFKSKYGANTQLITMLSFSDHIFHTRNIKTIHEITKKLRQTDNVIQVRSITNFPTTISSNDTTEIVDFIPETSKKEWTKKYLSVKKAQASSDDNFKNFLISKDQKKVAIYAMVRTIPGKEIQTNGEILKTVEKEIKNVYSSKDLDILFTGSVTIGPAFEQESSKDLMLILPIALISLSILLLVYLKSPIHALLTFMTVILTLITTIGIQGWLGIKINLLTTMAPIIVLGICLSDIIHIYSTYIKNLKYSAKKEALINSLEKNITPTFLTTATTAIGFLSLLTADINPIIQLGAISSIGVVIAWLYSFLFLTPLLYILPYKRYFSGKKVHTSNFQATYIFIKKRYKMITFTTSLIVLIATIISLQNIPNSHVESYFSPDTTFRRSSDFFKKHIGGTSSIELIVKEKNKNIKSYPFLKKVDQAIKEIEKIEGITKVVSVITNLKAINKTITVNDTNGDNIPTSTEKIAQSLFLLEISLPYYNGLYTKVDRDFSELRISIFWNQASSNQIIIKTKAIKKILIKHGLDGNITGITPLTAKLDRYLISSFFKSFLIVVLAIFVFIAFTFKSIYLGFIGILPNIIAPIFGAAAIYLSGQFFDIGCVLIFSISMGIAIDDTIYFLTRFNEARREGKNVDQSILYTLNSSAKTLIITTSILVFVFALFSLGSFTPNQNFALAISITLILALVIDLIFLPSLLMLIESMKTSKGANLPKQQGAVKQVL